MNKFELKDNFTNQLKEIDEKIEQIQDELRKAKEYKLKLEGGLETIQMLIKEDPVMENPTSNVSVDPGELPPPPAATDGEIPPPPEGIEVQTE